MLKTEKQEWDFGCAIPSYSTMRDLGIFVRNVLQACGIFWKMIGATFIQPSDSIQQIFKNLEMQISY